jgi:hypothetical protein
MGIPAPAATQPPGPPISGTPAHCFSSTTVSPHPSRPHHLLPLQNRQLPSPSPETTPPMSGARPRHPRMRSPRSAPPLLSSLSLLYAWPVHAPRGVPQPVRPHCGRGRGLPPTRTQARRSRRAIAAKPEPFAPALDVASRRSLPSPAVSRPSVVPVSPSAQPTSPCVAPVSAHRAPAVFPLQEPAVEPHAPLSCQGRHAVHAHRLSPSAHAPCAGEWPGLAPSMASSLGPVRPVSPHLARRERVCVDATVRLAERLRAPRHAVPLDFVRGRAVSSPPASASRAP